MDIKVSPNSKQINFGIYLKTNKTSYGWCDVGKYKGNNIEIYHDTREQMKLQYVSDHIRRFLQSKLVYFINGVRKITRSYGNGLQR